MDWQALLTGAVVGGLLSQLVSVSLTAGFTAKREFGNWLRQERLRVYSELLDLVATSDPECGVEQWPGKVRSLCQRVYLLHPHGYVPDPLYYAMEAVFQSVQAAKEGRVDDSAAWKDELRARSNRLREELARGLHESKISLLTRIKAWQWRRFEKKQLEVK